MTTLEEIEMITTKTFARTLVLAGQVVRSKTDTEEQLLRDEYYSKMGAYNALVWVTKKLKENDE